MAFEAVDAAFDRVAFIVLGSSARLFRDEGPRKELSLIDTTTFSSGGVALTYQPAGTEAKE